MFLLVMVLDDPTRLDEVLAAWVAAGAPGVTVLESTGVHRVLTRTEPDPAFAGFGRMFGGGKVGHNTLFAVVTDMDVAESVSEATQGLLGSLDEPNTGIVFAVPVSKVWGLPQPYAGETETGS